MAGSGTRARAQRRINEICAAATTSRELRLATLDVLRDALAFDSYVWLLTDPITCVGAGPLADVPSLDDVPALTRLKYLTEVNRWTDLGDSGVASLVAATGGERDRSLLWREMLRGYGVEDVLSAAFIDRWGCWAFLDLWRDREFDAADVDLLTGVHAALTGALRRCAAAAFVASPDSTWPDGGPAVLLLSPRLEVLAQTGDTQDYLRRLVPRDGGGDPVPSGAYNVSAQLLAVEAGIDSHPPRARHAFSAGRWLTMRAARIGSGSPSGRNIAVTIEPATPADRAAVFGRAHGLTPRETDVLGLLAEGHDTRSIARRLMISEGTILDHIKSLFAKTAVSSRGELLARVVGPP